MLPFLLIFTVIYAILQKTKIVGDGKKNFNVIIALVFSLLVVIPHILGTYPPGGDVVLIINNALPEVGLLIIGILMVLVMLGVFGVRWKIMGTSWATIFLIFSIIMVLYIFGVAAGNFGLPYWLSWLDDPQARAIFVMILVFGILIWFITKEDKSPEERAKSGFGKAFKAIGDSLKEA
ncbi:hypothetical protein D6745_02780 [Candidatus Woesearchaeota archaeon]|nr:MAG: hypothetical protein D6745_02780 [Candidatus Woesearchaeota archaeon]